MVEPIAFVDDKLNRKEIAYHFKNILLNTELNVFSLVATWGGGKTYFIQNLIKMMGEESINILYNAWESDFYKYPLIPLLTEFLNNLENSYKISEIEEDIKNIKKIAQSICNKMSFQLGIDLKVLKCSVNFDPNKKMIDSEYIELKQSISEFKNKLQCIQKRLNKKIIIFIDELDRCEPMYTIKTLEVVKHFFGIPNIVFVLSVDKSQIENSVRTIFGINIGNESGYLRKFIDVEFRLPEPNLKNFINYHLNNIWNKIKYFSENNRYYNYNLKRRTDSFGIKRDMDSDKEKEFITDVIYAISALMRFSLRDIEKYFMRFSLILDELHENDILFIEPCIVLNALTMYSIEDFHEYIKGTFSKNYLLKLNNIFSVWNGVFLQYKEFVEEYMVNPSVQYNTTLSNVGQLYDFLFKKVSEDLSIQAEYLKNYPLKIEFINNFNQFS